jgi:adenine-specific DNA-methyltransferase
MSELIAYCAELQCRYLNSTGSEHLKKMGQVFTPPEIAEYMAGLFSPVPRHVRLLDPGAGVGILAAAYCERLLKSRSGRTAEVHAFENDPRLADLLAKNLTHCREKLARSGHVLDFVVHQEDFIAAASPSLDESRLRFDDEIPKDFDAVIVNPPYFKLRRDSRHARLMDRVVHGQPNAYAIFLALAAHLLKENGELVAITPRSFCNGLYFRGFRRWFLDRMAIDHIHLFESRTDTFGDQGVLQEAVITKSHRCGRRTSSVSVSTSVGKKIAPQTSGLECETNEVIDDSRGDAIIRIPVCDGDREVMRIVESMPLRFDETGLRISTGPVVVFRAAEWLLHDRNGESAVSLLMAHNVKPFATSWPVVRKDHPKYIIDSKVTRDRRLLVPLRNYVVLKRFSAKEERRRLVAGCLLRESYRGARIGLENHLNYVYHFDRDLDEEEVYGIAALFNSDLLDRYFRVFSGNTQVNAREIRSLPFPSMPVLGRIGAEIKHVCDPSPSVVDEIVLRHVTAADSLSEKPSSITK